jgi:hypothetical protein
LNLLPKTRGLPTVPNRDHGYARGFILEVHRHPTTTKKQGGRAVLGEDVRHSRSVFPGLDPPSRPLRLQPKPQAPDPTIAGGQLPNKSPRIIFEEVTFQDPKKTLFGKAVGLEIPSSLVSRLSFTMVISRKVSQKTVPKAAELTEKMAHLDPICSTDPTGWRFLLFASPRPILQLD